MRKVESCFQRLEQRVALFTPGPARADRFLKTVSPAPAAVVGTTLLSVRQQSQNRPAHQTNAQIQERIKITKNSNLKPQKVLPMF
jgi:hypothetical protein